MVLSKSEWFNWSNKEEARIKMTKYIRSHFSELLGADIQLLDLPNGLDLIQDRVRARLTQSGIATAECLTSLSHSARRSRRHPWPAEDFPKAA